MRCIIKLAQYFTAHKNTVFVHNVKLSHKRGEVIDQYDTCEAVEKIKFQRQSRTGQTNFTSLLIKGRKSRPCHKICWLSLRCQGGIHLPQYVVKSIAVSLVIALLLVD